MNRNNIMYIHCTQIMDLIEILQWMNIIYEIHETYYTDIKWFEAHNNNLSELKPMHTWVNKNQN